MLKTHSLQDGHSPWLLLLDWFYFTLWLTTTWGCVPQHIGCWPFITNEMLARWMVDMMPENLSSYLLYDEYYGIIALFSVWNLSNYARDTPGQSKRRPLCIASRCLTFPAKIVHEHNPQATAYGQHVSTFCCSVRGQSSLFVIQVNKAVASRSLEDKETN